MTTLAVLNLLIGVILILAIFIFLIAVSRRSNLLRDQITDPIRFLRLTAATKKFQPLKTNNKADIPRPYSLSRTQFAVWTAVIAAGYAYLHFIRFPDKDVPFDATVLALMGISIGTATGGGVIDNIQSDKFRHQNQPSDGFWHDILSDENGVSIGRFQQVVWTAIALIVFIYKLVAATTPQFPHLDPALLFLAGLSNAAYLTLKVGENAGDSAKAALVDGLLSNGVGNATPPTPKTNPAPGKQQQPAGSQTAKQTFKTA